ncbi:MAG: c-type cytochrome [Gallionella sp.]|nr:c-type cytochrome [Gallionella sp.]
MKKQILILAASLALLAGCGGKENGTGASGSAPASAEASVKVTAVPAPATIPAPSRSDDGMEQTAAVPDLVTGEKVYKGTCSICHKSGLKGAPRMGIKEDWEARLTQGNEILYDHAVNGFRGKKGFMPSRGSNAKLSDTEVRAAVDYMVVHAVPSWTVGN